MKTKKKIRPIVEVSLELIFILFYIWYLERAAPPWLRTIFFWGLCVGFPLYCIGSEQKYFPEFSLDWYEFLNCLTWLIWFTLIGTIFLIALSIHYKTFNYDGRFLTRLSEYFFWAFLQQIGFQTFLTRRVAKTISNPYGAACLSSTLFALIHLPNTVLFLFTWIGGFFWALSFIRTPNLYALAVSHGWLAVVALYCVPKRWLHGLRIGPTYWTY